MPYPNFIIAGPPKTATTSIFEWLSLHPEAHPSIVKETYYFYDEAGENSPFLNYNKDGWSKYESLFKGWDNQKIIFESSPGYVYSDLAAEKLGEIKNIKVLIVYRSASDRIFSEYHFTRYKTKNFAGSFGEFVGYDGEDFKGVRFERLHLSKYISKWLEHLDAGQVKICLFDEIKKNPKSVMQRLSDFLEIDPSFFNVFTFEKKNETFGLRNRRLHVSILKLKRFIPKFVIRAFTPFYYFFNKKSIPKISTEEENLKRLLAERLKEEEDSFLTKFSQYFL